MEEQRIDKKILREIVGKIKQQSLTKKQAWVAVKKICKEHKLTTLPTNVQILDVCTDEEKEKLKKLLLLKPTRTASGVAIITVACKPAECPGRCLYCPRGENAPQSYTGMEPAIQRAIRNKYDPFKQVADRLNQYRLMGHPVDKIELIIIGGTFLAAGKKYQEGFVRGLYDALNGAEIKSKSNSKTKSKSKSLLQAQKINETAAARCSGLAIETRADYCMKPHINRMLKFGVTRVEIGLQSIYPDVLKKITRMHTVDDAIVATQLAKDSCLKCTYHIMPGLFVDQKKDLEQFKILFGNPDFRPDSLKIYPTLVIKNTELYKMWKAGDYKPLSNQQAVKLLAECMRYVPKYCRIIRVQRDIPKPEIVAGVNKSNLRELVEQRAERIGIRIREIRYREVGHRIERGSSVDLSSVKLCRLDYDASGGREIFLSMEDEKNNVLVAFLRLRIPGEPFRPEITDKTALVRELHVYGPSVRIGEKEKTAWQHRGFGRRLLEQAEKIAVEEFEKNKMVVISGVGVRKYYYGLGYKLDGPYVSKKI